MNNCLLKSEYYWNIETACVDRYNINTCLAVLMSCKYESFKKVTDTCVHVRLFMCECI